MNTGVPTLHLYVASFALLAACASDAVISDARPVSGQPPGPANPPGVAPGGAQEPGDAQQPALPGGDAGSATMAGLGSLAIDASTADALEADAAADSGADDVDDAGLTVEGQGALVVEVLTKPTGHSRYEPRNLLAVWVENGAGEPIKVLFETYSVFAGLQTYLERAAPRSIFGDNPGVVDADTVTTATLPMHDVRVVSWNMTDSLGAPVADGPYTIMIESADDRAGSLLTSVVFDKADAPVLVELPETDEFGPITLRYSPP